MPPPIITCYFSSTSFQFLPRSSVHIMKRQLFAKLQTAMSVNILPMLIWASPRNSVDFVRIFVNSFKRDPHSAVLMRENTLICKVYKKQNSGTNGKILPGKIPVCIFSGNFEAQIKCQLGLFYLLKTFDSR